MYNINLALNTTNLSVQWDPFQEHVEAYFGLEKYVTNGVQGRRLSITAENDCRRLHCTLRDLSSLLQALGRLADHFIGEHFADRYTNARLLVERYEFHLL